MPRGEPAHNNRQLLMPDLPVNPEVMKWARETAGMTVDDVVAKIDRKRVDAATVTAWEDGSKSPTYPQLERLAYEIYKRPLAIFFFPEPPEEVTPRQSFRTLPDYEIELMSPRMRALLRKATALQINLAELHDGVNPSERQIIRELVFEPDSPATLVAEAVRGYLSVNLDAQFKLKDSEHALKYWREVLEDVGVFVFKDAFKDDAFSGFCLYDDSFPLIYVNNSKPFNRQIFTLFHELAHLLFRTGGVDTNVEDYLDYLSGDDRLIEILCNKFAGEFLVPSADFDARIRGLRIDEGNISELADTYHVSREVILRKFLDRDEVSQRYYQERVADWRRSAKARTPGGNYYANMGVYLSDRYMEKAFSRYHRDQIGIDQLADYLGVKVKSVPGIEELVLRRGSAA